MVYLDYAAATPVDKQVLAAMEPYWRQWFYNPSALYDPARQVKRDLQEARTRTARTLNAKPRDVYFTAGATEANNLAISGLLKQYPGSRIVITPIEHEAVRRAAFAYGDVREARIDDTGRVTAQDVVAAIDEQTVLVSLDYVNSEIGTMQPLRPIAREIQNIRQQRAQEGNQLPLILHTDASQAVECFGLDVEALDVDMATVNIAKLYGPKQCGVLYVRRSVSLEPAVYGGGQERGLRSGTENVAFAVGAAKALELAESGRTARVKRYQKLQQQLQAAIESIPETTINGDPRHRAPTHVHASFKGVDGETLVHHLNAHDILAATGSACSANADEPSHVLTALELSPERINGSLRLTLGRSTGGSDITYAAEVLSNVIPRLRRQRMV